MDRDTEKNIRTTCPECGSSKTYYNERFKVWRCGKCEAAFKVSGFGEEKRPWWKRLFGIR
jgi:ribosomal protein L37AE/L43A